MSEGKNKSYLGNFYTCDLWMKLNWRIGEKVNFLMEHRRTSNPGLEGRWLIVVALIEKDGEHGHTRPIGHVCLPIDLDGAPANRHAMGISELHIEFPCNLSILPLQVVLDGAAELQTTRHLEVVAG
jgi:hypothetical protein